MKKLKDILYDKNDILVALVIISVAALVIIGRIDSILAYPGSLSADRGSSVDEPLIPAGEDNQEGSQDEAVDDPEKDIETSNTDTKNEDDSASVTDDTTNSSNNKKYTIHIEYGSTGEDIAATLVSSGLMESKQEFYRAVAAAGADSKLQAGDFTIPSNATAAEVVDIITR